MAHSVLDATSSQQCSEMLASALAALDTKNLSRAEETSQDAADTLTRDLLCRRVRGRVLGLISCQHLMSGSMMTAEGLIRSALSDLPTAARVNTMGQPGTPRNVHTFAEDIFAFENERAQILKGYGQMLKHWDKREREGDKYVSEAQEIMNRLVFSESDGGRVPLTCLLKVPPLIEL
jgi:hypothetical protein